jgi:modulator of FtsH protease
VEQDWGNFAVVAGSSAGALTGLLFVAVSLNRERIARHAPLRGESSRSATTQRPRLPG